MEQRQDDTLPYQRKEPREGADHPEPTRSAEVGPDASDAPGTPDAVDRPRLELLEERLAARKREQQTGEVVVRKETEEVPSRLDVESYRDEVEVEHIPVGRVVNEREEPRQEGDVLVVPVYEEQVVMVKRLVLREYVRVRRTRATEHQVYAETLRRDRLVVEDPQGTGQVREVYRGAGGEDLAERKPTTTGSVLEWLKRALFS